MTRGMRILGLLLGVALVLGGCGFMDERGTIALSLTDASIDAEGVTGVYVTITEIQYNLNGDWQTFGEFVGPQSHNLLDLTGGNSVLLADGLVLPAGQYNQLRFLLDAPAQGSAPPSSPGSYIEFRDGTQAALFVPSGSESGYKAVGTFSVPVNGVVEITADFDVRRAVVAAGTRYLVKPTIRLVVNDQAGWITGGITNPGTTSDILLLAYEDGEWTDTEDDPPPEEEARFPNAVTSDRMGADGTYRLSFLAAGTYDLVVAQYDGDAYVATWGLISDVVVEEGTGTTQHVDETTVVPLE